MDKLIITLLVVIGVLVLFLGIALEEIKTLQQDKRDWKTVITQRHRSGLEVVSVKNETSM